MRLSSRAFASPAAFREWLARHHRTSTELIVRCFKTSAADKGLTYRQALDEARSGVYSFERAAMTLTPAFAMQFRASKDAWRYFSSQPPWYQRTSIYWVMSAKREETRARRLATLIEWSAKTHPIPPLARKKA